MRSRSQIAICEENGVPSRAAMRYGRINSPGRPRITIPVNPMIVAKAAYQTGHVAQRAAS